MNDSDIRQLEIAYQRLRLEAEHQVEKSFRWKRQRLVWTIMGILGLIGVLMNGLPPIVRLGIEIGWITIRQP